MRDFYNTYYPLFMRFFRAMEGRFLKEFLSGDIGWNRNVALGFSYFVRMREENVVFIDCQASNSQVEYPEMIGIPYKDLSKKLDAKWKPVVGDLLEAMICKVVPAFWNDLITVIGKKRMNLDLLDLNTPSDMTKISYQEGFLIVYATSIPGKPLVYSVDKRLPSEWEILRRIKSLYTYDE